MQFAKLASYLLDLMVKADRYGDRTIPLSTAKIHRDINVRCTDCSLVTIRLICELTGMKVRRRGFKPKDGGQGLCTKAVYEECNETTFNFFFRYLQMVVHPDLVRALQEAHDAWGTHPHSIQRLVDIKASMLLRDEELEKIPQEPAREAEGREGGRRYTRWNSISMRTKKLLVGFEAEVEQKTYRNVDVTACHWGFLYKLAALHNVDLPNVRAYASDPKKARLALQAAFKDTLDITVDIDTCKKLLQQTLGGNTRKITRQSSRYKILEGIARRSNREVSTLIDFLVLVTEQLSKEVRLALDTLDMNFKQLSLVFEKMERCLVDAYVGGSEVWNWEHDGAIYVEDPTQTIEQRSKRANEALNQMGFQDDFVLTFKDELIPNLFDRRALAAA